MPTRDADEGKKGGALPTRGVDEGKKRGRVTDTQRGRGEQKGGASPLIRRVAIVASPRRHHAREQEGQERATARGTRRRTARQPVRRSDTDLRRRRHAGRGLERALQLSDARARRELWSRAGRATHRPRRARSRPRAGRREEKAQTHPRERWFSIVDDRARRWPPQARRSRSTSRRSRSARARREIRVAKRRARRGG